jgi:hypothetical protein
MGLANKQSDWFPAAVPWLVRARFRGTVGRIFTVNSQTFLMQWGVSSRCALLLAVVSLSAFGQNTASMQTASHASNRRIPGGTPRALAAVMGMVQATDDRAIGGATVILTSANGHRASGMTSGDGVFRIAGLEPGTYSIKVSADEFESVAQAGITLAAGDVLAVELRMRSNGTLLKRDREIATAPGGGASGELPPYREISRRNLIPQQPEPEVQVSAENNAIRRANRWELEYPGWDRYADRQGEFPYVFGRWFDPFNRNRLKGDYPLFGNNTFFNFTGTSTTAVDVRRLYVPSGVSGQNPGNENFFGHGGQQFLAQTFRFSFDLFHGDTSFKPVDWRIRVTPAINLNQIWTGERGIVSPNVTHGTDRFDYHAGLQEAFGEVKVHDLSSNYDFFSVRAGIQQFTSDFKGFIFSDEQPGVRIFGDLRSNRIQYNLAYFDLLEKDTNSGLNTLHRRDQDVAVANVYIQDFFAKGYTVNFSYLFNSDNGKLHYDDNGFLVRPAPLGTIVSRPIRSSYFGWSGLGHIGRLNLNHAFYQVLGHDQLNPVAGRYTDINAQFAAVELSYDHDWYRPRVAFLYASGDRDPRDGTARGFDSIVDAQTFAGGIFSFFNREGIRLTGTDVALTAPDSFLPDLRSNEEEGKASYVNPGLFLWNAGFDAEVTQNLKLVTNFNAMRFAHTEPLELLLFQSQIPTSLGLDYSTGFVYRPLLSDNLVFTAGIAGFTPGSGLRRIYTSQTLFSAFSVLRFQF